MHGETVKFVKNTSRLPKEFVI